MIIILSCSPTHDHIHTVCLIKFSPTRVLSLATMYQADEALEHT